MVAKIPVRQAFPAVGPVAIPECSVDRSLAAGDEQVNAVWVSRKRRDRAAGGNGELVAKVRVRQVVPAVGPAAVRECSVNPPLAAGDEQVDAVRVSRKRRDRGCRGEW